MCNHLIDAGVPVAQFKVGEEPPRFLDQLRHLRGYLEPRILALQNRTGVGIATQNAIEAGRESDPGKNPGESQPGVARDSTLSVDAVASIPARPAPGEPLHQRPRGAPKKDVAEKTRAQWAEMGKPPKLNAAVCDALAEHSYPDEYAKARLRSRARKTLRDRVAQQVRPFMNKPDPGVPAR